MQHRVICAYFTECWNSPSFCLQGDLQM